MDRTYTTKGTFFTVPTMTGHKALVSMDYQDYERLLALGIMDEEVDVTLRRAEYGIEYEQGAPEAKVRAGLYTIKIEGINVKPQMDIAEEVLPSVLERGFSDGDAVGVTIEALPYRNPREASYEGVKLDMNL